MVLGRLPALPFAVLLGVNPFILLVKYLLKLHGIVLKPITEQTLEVTKLKGTSTKTTK